MTDTINLRKDLVAQWTFDDRHLDTGQNVLKDSSGNGNHAELEGGISTGNPSPVGQSFSMDGVDDAVQIGTLNEANPLSNETGEATFFSFLYPKQDSEEDSTFLDWGDSGVYIRFRREGEGGVLIFDNTGDSSVSESLPEEEVDFREWIPVLVEADREETRITTTIGDAEISGDDFHLNERSETTSILGQDNPVTSRHFYGDVAFVGLWNRLLTRSEKQILKSLSGPRVMRV